MAYPRSEGCRLCRRVLRRSRGWKRSVEQVPLMEPQRKALITGCNCKTREMASAQLPITPSSFLHTCICGFSSEALQAPPVIAGSISPSLKCAQQKVPLWSHLSLLVRLVLPSSGHFRSTPAYPAGLRCHYLSCCPPRLPAPQAAAHHHPPQAAWL